MMAYYKVELKAPAPEGECRVTYEYVTAPDTKAGYAKAREKAEARMAKAGKPEYRGTAVNCVG